MARPWLLSLLPLMVEAATHAVQLSADGDMWEFPVEPARRMMRHHVGEQEAYVEQAPGTMVRILSNNTGKTEEFLRSLKEEAASANLGIGLALIGPLLVGMTLFYLVNQPISKDLQTSTWQLLSGNIALFSTVLIFMALKKSWKVILGSKAADFALLGDILAFMKFMLLMLGLPLLRSKLETMPCGPRTVPVLRVCGAYLIGFAGSDCFANFLRMEPFSNGAGFYLLGIILSFAVLAALLAVAFRVSQYGRSDAPYEPDREAEQIDAAGFQIGFLTSMWIRFLVTGFLPGSKKGAHALTMNNLIYLGVALVLSIITFSLMMYKVRPLADNPERKPVYRRIYRALTESSGMTMGWLLMYWVQWIFWYFLQSPDGSHTSAKHAALVSQAIASTILVYAALSGLIFIAKRMGKNVSDFTELNNAFVLQTGFCWEMAIYVGLVDSFTSRVSNPSSRRTAAMVWIVFLLVLILPAWFWYILPKTLKAEGKDQEGAKGSEGDAKDAKDPPKETPAKPAEPKPEEPKADAPTPAAPAPTPEAAPEAAATEAKAEPEGAEEEF